MYVDNNQFSAFIVRNPNATLARTIAHRDQNNESHARENKGNAGLISETRAPSYITRLFCHCHFSTTPIPLTFQSGLRPSQHLPRIRAVEDVLSYALCRSDSATTERSIVGAPLWITVTARGSSTRARGRRRRWNTELALPLGPPPPGGSADAKQCEVI